MSSTLARSAFFSTASAHRRDVVKHIITQVIQVQQPNSLGATIIAIHNAVSVPSRFAKELVQLAELLMLPGPWSSPRLDANANVLWAPWWDGGVSPFQYGHLSQHLLTILLHDLHHHKQHTKHDICFQVSAAEVMEEVPTKWRSFASSDHLLDCSPSCCAV
mmetsp:Transcript_66863/g.149203  ORF Transcript_66863/g.149203 Transcript_66863/m.149203 type:complete len:161 (-) Transcript_66863:113-595(-)